MKPWEYEPDRGFFTVHGIHCMVYRHSLVGHWCGYVALPQGHPWEVHRYDDLPAVVHGGLTFGSFINEDDSYYKFWPEARDRWVIGFDCGHCDDYSPRYPMLSLSTGVYRDFIYVSHQCYQLAFQVRESNEYPT